jgi:small subunit ribosomal protein S1
MESGAMETNEMATPGNLDDVQRKTHFSGKVVKTTLAGAIVDIGLETPGVVHISQLTKDPVNRVEDVVQVGQEVDVWIRRVQAQKGRIELTMIKPLDLEWREIKKDMVVKGKVIRLEKFGVFVEIGAERPGLVHVSELTHDYIHSPSDVVKEGDEVEVMVLGVNRQKKQIKLSMKALEERPVKEVKTVQEKSKVAAESTEKEKEEPVPTAMEMALREAMERVKTAEKLPVTKEKSKAAGRKDELEKILSRTLKQKVNSPSKQ